MQPPTLAQRARRALLRAFVAAYPWCHAAMEGSALAYHLAFLLGRAPAHRPVLHALGMQLSRVSAQDMVRPPPAGLRALPACCSPRGLPPGRLAAQAQGLPGLCLQGRHMPHALGMLLLHVRDGQGWWRVHGLMFQDSYSGHP